jgi:uncharacterized membrane protein YbaN (DUF454 family)
MTITKPAKLAWKLVAAVAVAVLLIFGIIGLILPILPGILFIGIAALILCRYFPSLGRRLKENPTLRSYLDRSDSFAGLSVRQKLQVGSLLCAKALVDGMAFVSQIVRPQRPRRVSSSSPRSSNS